MSCTTAIVLVGGFGTRIRHLTGAIPKPLAIVNGKPFLHWVLQSLKKERIENVYLLSHFRADLIEEFALVESKQDFTIKCITEKSPSGTGGCVLDFLTGASSLHKNLLILNGDSLLVSFDLRLAEDKIAMGYSGVIFGVPMEDSSRYGTLNVNGRMELSSFEEKMPGSGVINSGVYLFTRDIFYGVKTQVRPLSLERDLIPAMIKGGARIAVVSGERPFIDIGTEDSLSEADGFIRRNLSEINY